MVLEREISYVCGLVRRFARLGTHVALQRSQGGLDTSSQGFLVLKLLDRKSFFGQVFDLRFRVCYSFCLVDFLAFGRCHVVWLRLGAS